jgi:transposase
VILSIWSQELRRNQQLKMMVKELNYRQLALKNRVYICPDCDYKADRDLNAARNIDRWFVDIFIPVA